MYSCYYSEFVFYIDMYVICPLNCVYRQIALSYWTEQTL